MSKQKSWVKELNFILLAMFLSLSGVIIYGVLFDVWIKNPERLAIFFAYTFGAIIVWRILRWVFRKW